MTYFRIIYKIYFISLTLTTVQNDNQIDNTAEDNEKKVDIIQPIHTELLIPLQQVPTLVYQPYTQMVSPVFQPFVPMYPIIQPYPIIYPVPKRAKRTCMKCLKTSCTGAKTRVKKGENRICSTFNTLLD